MDLHVNPVPALAETPRRHGRAAVPGRGPGVGSLVLLALIVVSLLAASSAPTPLYATYARMWHFSSMTTTVVFGVYAIAVLLSLLVFGRVSDHLGRRPVLLAALVLQIAAMTVLTTAAGLDALLLGRVLQGLSTGGALGALGAAMLDIDRRRGTLANAAVPGIGTGTGALLSGWLVQCAPAPTHLVYLVLTAVFVAQGAALIRMPETASRTPGVRAALRPELAVPSDLRGPVLAAVPILFAVWALAGFYGSLGPALVRHLSGSASPVVAGLGLFLLAVTGSLAAVALDRTAPRTVMLLGIALLTAGALATLAAVDTGSTLGFFGGTTVAGLGFGAGYQGGIRTVVPRAAPHDRAGLLSVLFVVCYLGLGAPSVGAGVLIVHGAGLVSTARDYTLFILVLAAAALTGLLLTNRTARPARTGRAHSHRSDPPNGTRETV
ncbi:MFS transporter [Streptacidiphilus pinicola]|uniref:MFS transporter n=2 Tax=Streptacidiphilus pinicola TaxID=2219663 RepID=A0A2X0ITR2_9ACTN|nr:MFS transporter [Streptacidiphilus pinicola]